MDHLLRHELQRIREHLELQDFNTREYLTLSEAAQYLRVSKSFLYKKTCDPATPIAFSKPGKKIYFRRQDLDHFIASHLNSTTE